MKRKTTAITQVVKATVEDAQQPQAAPPEELINTRISVAAENAVFDIMNGMRLTEHFAPHIVRNALNRYLDTI
jgi:hypothetical protein